MNNSTKLPLPIAKGFLTISNQTTINIGGNQIPIHDFFIFRSIAILKNGEIKLFEDKKEVLEKNNWLVQNGLYLAGALIAKIELQEINEGLEPIGLYEIIEKSINLIDIEEQIYNNEDILPLLLN